MTWHLHTFLTVCSNMFQVIVWDLPKMFYLHTNMQTFWDQVKLLKGTVQPKMKILSFSLTVKFFQTCMSFFLLLNIKEDILKNVGIQTDSGFHWLPLWFFFHSMEFKQLFGCPLSAEINSYNLRVSTSWQDFQYWVNYPFKRPLCSPNLKLLPTEIKQFPTIHISEQLLKTT